MVRYATAVTLTTALLLAASPLRLHAQTVSPDAAAQSLPAQTGPSDAEREALTVTRYELNVHLTPAESRINTVARLSVRNDGKTPMTRLALDLSSTLQWEVISERHGDGAAAKLPMTTQRRDTDTDHTGAENEALFTLSAPLLPGGTTELTAIYSGTIARSSARLQRSGAPAADAEHADWDGIGEETSLRGFGNVLWYPVSTPPIFLGDGARLVDAAGRQRLRQSRSTVQLRLEVEYRGEPPQIAFFCGQSLPLRAVEEEAGAGESSPAGIAVGEAAATPLGFASPSLFIARAPLQAANRTVAVVTTNAADADRVNAAATAAKPLVSEWLGALRERQPVLLDHPGQPFAQGALLVEDATAAANSFAMIHLLSHAWFASSEVWLDEGVAQFLPIVAAEREKGRAAALVQLEDQRPALALAESNADQAGAESLVSTSREVMYRNKAVAVLWMLRELAGDDAMKKALLALRSTPLQDRNAKAFEAALEAASHKDLAWFFNDWVLADKGLPDLSIMSAAARANPGRQGIGEGYLVAVEVRNDGGAAAEVPVTVRSGELTATERLRVPANGVASTRILFQGKPQEVEVNDGTVPEVSTSRHTRSLEP